MDVIKELTYITESVDDIHYMLENGWEGVLSAVIALDSDLGNVIDYLEKCVIMPISNEEVK